MFLHIELCVIFIVTLITGAIHGSLQFSIVGDASENSLHLNSIVSSRSLINGVTRTPCEYQEGADLVGLHTIEILRQQGYRTETHYVTTDDGYIFELHRVPAPGKPIVYLLPGVFQSSRDFLMNCQGRSLASKLIAERYDVWLGNYRGNTYGRNHTIISPDNPQFWKFGFHELFQHDGPAGVNYVLTVTGEPNLNWVGYSLGGNILFGMLSVRPDFNDKIKFAAVMGPIAYFDRTRSPIIRLLTPFRYLSEVFISTFFRGEVFASSVTGPLRRFFKLTCMEEAQSNIPGICSFILNNYDSKDTEQQNLPFLPAILSGYPASTSGTLFRQWLQFIASGKFRQFDYGFKRNLFKYGSFEPPAYNLSNVKVPLLTLWGENDFITSKEDVLRTVKDLPNLINNIRVDWDNWTHLDFTYAKDADILVYDHILKYLAQYN